jgi:uncharacterized protein YecE (DUF72 family)
MAHRYWVGTSGWVYPHWRGPFYPPDLPGNRWLEFYTERFPSVELNASFYRLPQEKTFSNWGRKVPDDFRFAVKASRFVTHIKRLKDCREPVETFSDRARAMGEHLGPILYQMPPNFHRNERNEAALSDFLSTLPRDLRHVFEFRHDSWFNSEVFALLRLHNVGFCAFHMVDWETPMEATTDFAYMRFHGSGALYGGCYDETELRNWAGDLRALPDDVQDIYVYFNNDAHGFAVQNARELARLLADEG